MTCKYCKLYREKFFLIRQANILYNGHRIIIQEVFL